MKANMQQTREGKIECIRLPVQYLAKKQRELNILKVFTVTFQHILYAREEMLCSHSFLNICSGLRLIKVNFLIVVLLLLVWVFD